jgi:hypothetical protein
VKQPCAEGAASAPAVRPGESTDLFLCLDLGSSQSAGDGCSYLLLALKYLSVVLRASRRGLPHNRKGEFFQDARATQQLVTPVMVPSHFSRKLGPQRPLDLRVQKNRQGVVWNDALHPVLPPPV